MNSDETVLAAAAQHAGISVTQARMVLAAIVQLEPGFRADRLLNGARRAAVRVLSENMRDAIEGRVA